MLLGLGRCTKVKLPKKTSSTQMRLEQIKRILPKESSPDWYQVREYIGGGSDGDVYRYGRDQVIKFGNKNGAGKTYEAEWKRLFDILKKTNYKYIVKPYDIEIIPNTAYWYTTDYLADQLDDREQKEFKTVILILDNKWGVSKKKPPAFAMKKISPQWRTFVKSLDKFREKFGFTNSDLHPENIMKNDLGVPKLIDLESFIDWSL